MKTAYIIIFSLVTMCGPLLGDEPAPSDESNAAKTSDSVTRYFLSSNYYVLPARLLREISTEEAARTPNRLEGVYDKAGRLLSITTINKEKVFKTLVYTYDEKNHVRGQTLTYADGSQEIVTYDDSGNRLSTKVIRKPAK